MQLYLTVPCLVKSKHWIYASNALQYYIVMIYITQLLDVEPFCDFLTLLNFMML
jgi:hypothetical protein